jgi:flagellar basal body-associated protein FliL
MSEARPLTRTQSTRSRTATIIKNLGDPAGPAQRWTIAELQIASIQAEQCAAVAEALEAIRDIILEIRASMPLYAVEKS